GEKDGVFEPDYDRDASTNHAEARLEGGGWVLVDLNSRNGTYVRGERISRCALSSGDEVTFGKKGPRVRLELIPDAAPAAAPRMAKGSTVSMDVIEDAPAPRPASAPAIAPPAARPASAFAAPAPRPASAPAVAAPAPRPASAPAVGAAPAPGPILEAPPAGKRVGQRTIAMMIS